MLAPLEPLLCPAGTKLADDFTGKVVEVVSGDCLVVKDSASGVERRVNLSSLRAPRMGRKGERPETYATEAKEFLRQRLIGEQIGACGRFEQLWSDHDTSDAGRSLTCNSASWVTLL